MRDSEADLYVLGDSPIHYGTTSTTHDFTDGRLAGLPLTEYATYTANLRAGHGYGDEHRAALIALQRAQARYRNTEHGYWIAETDPEAAHHAIGTTLGIDAIAWAVLATDGAAEPIAHLGHDDWPDIAHYDGDQLAALLARIHRWEQHRDPDGTSLPQRSSTTTRPLWPYLPCDWLLLYSLDVRAISIAFPSTPVDSADARLLRAPQRDHEPDELPGSARDPTLLRRSGEQRTAAIT